MSPSPSPAIMGYVRVSTSKQDASGLGQAAQRAAIQAHAKRTGSRILGIYEEVESGRKSARPELTRALAEARRQGATLVIARLDRLGRNVAFLSKLMDAGTEFVALDVPGANRLTLHVLAAVAENEARAVSERTKAALQAAKARGTKLGTPKNLTQSARQRGADARARQARERYGLVGPLVIAWRKEGRSYAAIANELNVIGREFTGWTPEKVRRVERYSTA
jgi:DNA invertase Pin-like site-specific DNA recombinase